MTNEDRCSDCHSELSACGELTDDGTSMDCRVCQLKCELRTLATEYKQETARREELEAAFEDIRERIKPSIGAAAKADDGSSVQVLTSMLRLVEAALAAQPKEPDHAN